MNKILPKVAWLTTNRTCNNKCKWCYTFNYNCNNKEMNFKKIKQIIDELSNFGVKKIILIGGEPTINNKIIEIIKYIKEKNILVSIASNGRKFSDISFTKKCKDIGLDFVNISIKGVNEEEYISNTNSFGFNEMIKGYNNLIENGIETSLSYVITKNNEKEYENLKTMLNDNNINYIFFMLYKPSVDLDDKYNGPTMYELANACKTVYEVFKDSDINIKFEMSLPLCILDKNLLNELLNKNMIATCCHISKGKGIIFDTDFNILPCNHFVDHPLNKNPILPSKIVSFWNSNECSKFRKIVKTYPSIKCKNCDKWNICGGGCTLRWLKDNPNDIIK